MKLPFVKAEGTGNDFVIFDAKDIARIKDLSGLSGKLCDRKKSIGADGILIYDKSVSCDFKMRIFNPDGSEAEMCGNGIRCIAQYAKKNKRLKKDKFDIETKAGLIKIDYLKKDVPRLKLTGPKDLRLNFSLEIDKKEIIVNYVVVGVPHVVYLSNNVDAENVAGMGRAIRFHDYFKPAGTNVNFVEVISPDSIKIKTYERGVEAETLACGSGASAASLIVFLLGRIKSPVSVITSGKEVLTVYLEGNKEKPENIYLEAEARLVFEGKIDIN